MLINRQNHKLNQIDDFKEVLSNVYDVSIVLPSYNEEKDIHDIFLKIRDIINTENLNYEIIFVDDGSIDQTKNKIMELINHKHYNEKNNVKIVSYKNNMGKGYAIKQGYLRASGENIIFLDSDLNIQPNQVLDYLNKLKKYDVVIGSKIHPDSRVMVPLLRKYLSFSFSVLVRILTDLKYRDTQSGLKAIKKDSLKSVFSKLNINRFAFDVELLLVAQKHNLKICELPIKIINYNNFINIVDIWKMFLDLLIISYNNKIKKSYRKIDPIF